jgi:HAD superfamily hydrolase (TIGR01509 family)
MRPSRTLIFDLSEVLIAGMIGVERPLARRLHLKPKAILKVFETHGLDDLCRGRLTEDEYLAGILRATRWAIAAADLKRAIRVNFHRRVPGMAPLLRRLARNYELVLLSDHSAEWAAYIRRIHPWLRRFKRRFFSFELGQMKRNPSTFRRVLAALGRQPGECLFIDDSARNVQAAASVGLRGIRFTSAAALARELDPWLAPFRFRNPGRLVDGELELVLTVRQPADPVKKWVPQYQFEMRRTGTARRLGLIHLRIGPARILRYAGHVGYEVDSSQRGHRYAARSCRLLLPFARAHGLRAVWITTDPANLPSRRTCELVGARYVETVRIPRDHEMYRSGARFRRRYRLGLRQPSSPPPAGQIPPSRKIRETRAARRRLKPWITSQRGAAAPGGRFRA